MTTAQAQTPLPALPSLTSNPTFFPTTPADQDASGPSALLGKTTSSTPYYPPLPTIATHQPAPVTSPRLLSITPTRTNISAVPKSTSGNGLYGLSVSQSQASQAATDWEVAFERQEEERWGEKIRSDLSGWRGGHGTIGGVKGFQPDRVVRSTYSRTAVPGLSYFGQAKTGVVGLHLPKEVIRVERDWSDGEICQFETSFPMELDGRITPMAFQSLIESINTRLTAAYSIRGAAIDNLIAIASWWTSIWWRTSCFERNLQAAEKQIKEANEGVFNPAGLNVLSPRDVALQYLEIEYY
ncbi:Golgin subfamily A member 7/ERF4 family-domain-containing protein [Dioszegia hungarica]|uniref:Ras modification protein ERF4 n=1 Tax=Dioszegia hungarica TaxID=4972 RepID=A0AA38H2D9_9TREE|nr:Golgin subfamily A member 7/ERF4 family-domain-containing protein [Dioszegia hungarica]KAI9632918.1 Golgin subfamily A member 7/ERF4 family-domain-containing protein [Dioszegia hungarica]